MTRAPRSRNGPTSAVALRRNKVADLWLRGTPTARIARHLKTPETTIRRDLTAIKAELLTTHHATIEHARARSLAVLRTVQHAAWTAFAKAKDNANAKPGYLNAILSAEQLVAKIEGIVQPDVTSQTTVNILAAGEWQAARSVLLAALAPFPDARVAAAEALAQLEAPTPTPIVEASHAGDHTRDDER